MRRAGGEPRVLRCDGTAPSLDGARRRAADRRRRHRPGCTTARRRTRRRRADAGRDAFELALAQLALRERACRCSPICRGMQVLNVAAGGTLDAGHPGAGAPARSAIRSTTPLIAIAHEVWVTHGIARSRAHAGRARRRRVLQVNSRHHQAVARPRRRLRRLRDRARRRHRSHRAPASALLRRRCSGTPRTSGAPASSARCSRNS